MKVVPIGDKIHTTRNRVKDTTMVGCVSTLV